MKTYVFWHFFPILTVFQSLCLSGAILAHQTSNGKFSRSWRIFWHPWHPWGWINSGDISFLVFIFDFSVWQRHLVDFFHYSQIEARCHLYWFVIYKSENMTFYSQNGWIFKVIQAVGVVIWMELEEISPVCNGLMCPSYPIQVMDYSSLAVWSCKNKKVSNRWQIRENEQCESKLRTTLGMT